MNTNEPVDAIQQAIQVLRSEESELTGRISVLQNRIGSVRTAISSMQALLSQESGPVASPVALSMNATSLDMGGAYVGLPFSKALEKFMHTMQSPMSAGDIAKKMVEAGYVFTAKNASTQVHVGLKRNEDKLYQRFDNRWLAKRS